MSALSKLQSYFSRYGAYLVFLGSERIKPGRLLNAHYPWPFGQTPTFKGEQGFAWEFTNESEADYPSALFDANYIQEQITDKTSLSSGVTLPQFGLTVDEKYKSDFSVSIRLTGVKSRGFISGISLPNLQEKLLRLRKSDPGKWTWVNDDYLVAESFHVTEFEASFRSDGELSAKAAYQQGELNLSGHLEYTWKDEVTLTAKGPVSVPIAVRGIKI